ncbi:hypothetical protein AArcSl_2649 [Halalkaliarchaeum desulfuricum]|uniref:AI-2E family transporter n=1 Tax=Halalkaliarchaeum desulfuricum TaxID=2055893 RepID=A0A343TME6_9EURY|nr:AI-2E family transporter [Halalkaliarchaeum desulfuricum]AUX10268.1 hypothetical protein AArcSl_2649 [Halalkaliarchaeum desulfuricum]
MDTDDRDPSWFTEEQAIVVFTLGIIILAVLVIMPYLQYILFGVIFAYLLSPIHRRLVNHIRRDLSALVLTIMTVIGVAIPLVYLIGRLAQEAFAVVQAIQNAELGVTEIEVRLLEMGIELDIHAVVRANREMIESAAEMLAVQISQAIQNLPNIFIGLTITVFVLFVMLRDGDRLVTWVRATVPIRNEIQSELHQKVNRLMWASIIGNGGAGLIQTFALGVAFWFLGFNNLVLLMVLTFVLALLPLVGAFAVWLPLVGYLFVVGRPTAAAMLFVFGSLVSVSDFYTRPIIIGHSGALNSAVIVVGVFGGLVIFGPIGLLIGPVILGGSKIAIETLVRARDEDLTAAG